MLLLQRVSRKSKDSQEDKETSLSTSKELTEETKFVEELTEEMKCNEKRLFVPTP